ncbi:hypothetical protein [Streptomyces turgidiscabies]|uniref:Uncharacterized protein n=1 Tax=Streptomyces turgidiscabies TaxID=85558 RepID=A0ABU0RRN7_9ACTN|nr:hypothetical protein [Streptomyces turgidiscabies]MDQ0933812.1 hypothetical protein [Streptomyces turgidiscabies]
MTVEIHPATARMLENFRYDHLPAFLQEISKPFHDLAHRLVETLTGPEVTKALDGLWASKNLAVVAASNSSLEGAPPAPRAPAVGDVVLVPADPAENNGAAEAPAVVTRVWSATTVNVRVLLDSEAVIWRTSVLYRENLDALEGVPAVWTWPVRV